MPDEELERRQNMSFSQAEGLAPLPDRLKLGELSHELRAAIWKDVYVSIMKSRDFDDEYSLLRPWADISFDFFVKVLHKPADEWSDDTDETVAQFKSIILRQEYNIVFDALQFVMRHPDSDLSLANDLAVTFERGRAAYYLDLSGNPTIMPAASPEEAAAVREAFASLNAPEHSGARQHLGNAGEELNAGHFAASVRESISAVESIAKVISGKDKATLDDAMKALDAKHDIHPALKKAVVALYGYTGDEKGVRHALTDQPSKVGLAEAQFMLGACASFISYILQKSRAM